jgi:hypothetical protein
MSSFLNDVSYLGPLQGIGAGPKDRWSRVLAIVHSPVPCKEEFVSTKCAAVPITIVRILDAGFSSAPYTAAKKGSAPAPQTGVKPEPLFRVTNSKSTPELDVWSYVSKGMNRGVREDGEFVDGGELHQPMYTLATGDTFIFFVNPLTFQGSSATTVLPTDMDWIPSMSLVELCIAPRHVESCLAGRGINVKTMRISTTEIDAVFQRGIDAVGMPSSLEDACRVANTHRDRYPALLKDLEVEKVSFVAQAKSLSGAYMGELPVYAELVDAGVVSSDAIAPPAVVEQSPDVPLFVKMIVGTVSGAFPGCEYVDIPMHCLRKQTNTKSDAHACALLDIALAMGAVNLWVVTDPRWANKVGSSPYRAVPIIDTVAFFGALELVRSVGTDHAMVAKVVNGEILKDTNGVEVLDRIELCDDVDGDAEDGCMLTLRTGVQYDDGFLDLVVKIHGEDLTKTKPLSTASQSNMALALVGPGVKTTKGYAFQFNVRAVDEANNIPRILYGFLNRAPCGGSNSGLIARKRKAIRMLE